MSHAYYSLGYHIIFATKGRERWLDDSLRPSVLAHLAEIVTDLKAVCLEINGRPDQVHILAKLRPDQCVSNILRAVKSTSTGRVRRRGMPHFGWQTGYGAFTVSHWDIEAVRAYIRNQEEHHREMTLQDEMLSLCRKHGIEIDEATMWD
jgi:REP element-mobilizing transposase RayT